MPHDFVQENFFYTENEVPLSVFESTFGMGKDSLYLHCHDCMELLYVKNGSGFISVELQKFFVQAGDFILVSPGQLHSANSPFQDRMFCQAIVFDLNQLREGKIDYIYRKYISSFFNQDISPPVLINKQSTYYQELCRDFFTIYTEYKQKQEAYECFVKSSLFHLLGIFYRNSQKTSLSCTSQKQNREKIKIVLQYILEHYDQTITIDQAAALTGYSKYYFMHFFKSTTGFTLTQYVNMVRLDKAAQLLLNSQYSITEISTMTGFGNLSYFIRQFTQRYQKTPRQFRK